MKKAISMLLVMGLSAGLLAGCGAKSVSGSEEATAENPMVLTLSHGLSETHTVHIAMEEFAEKVEERTDGFFLLANYAELSDRGTTDSRCHCHDKGCVSDFGNL